MNYHVLGDPYNQDGWNNAPLGTLCVNSEFPGCTFRVIDRGSAKGLVWISGPRPNSSSYRGAAEGFFPAPAWTRPLLYSTKIMLPTGA